MGYALVMDTETTSIDKPFCYDLGWVVLDMDNGRQVENRHYIIEQVWHNLPLFESAYYKDKREKYVSLLRSRRAILDKWGYALRALRRDIQHYGITDAYAYNSNFDDGVMTFNCDWYKVANPLDNIAIHDIWGYASQLITCRPDYHAFCEEHERFTESGNYKSSAEVVYQYITQNPDFVEEHMGLYDSQIEADILWWCVERGCPWAADYPTTRYLNRNIETPFKVKIDGIILYEGEYIKKYVRNNIYSFTTTEKGT